jgi:hypothetical protein
VTIGPGAPTGGGMADLTRIVATLLWSTLAHASPTPIPAITVELDEESAPALAGLVAVTEEPGGLAVPIEGTAAFARYGLLPGDVIRAANGSLVFDTLRVMEGTPSSTSCASAGRC